MITGNEIVGGAKREEEKELGVDEELGRGKGRVEEE